MRRAGATKNVHREAPGEKHAEASGPHNRADHPAGEATGRASADASRAVALPIGTEGTQHGPAEGTQHRPAEGTQHGPAEGTRPAICQTPPMGADDAQRIFIGIADTYDRVATVLSLGQDPRWRRALVDAIQARPVDRVLDVATGTGMVARELRQRYGCSVVGLDQSTDMLRVARQRPGVFEAIVEGSAERLPFPDGAFDHLTFTYLLRYVDDPAATMRELARVVKPGGRVAMVEFGLPRGIWRPLWWLYTRLGLPLGGRMVSARWASVGAFLGPSIERFYAAHPLPSIERYWREAGLSDVRTRRMSLGGGVVISAVRCRSAEAVAPPAAQTVAAPAAPAAVSAAGTSQLQESVETARAPGAPTPGAIAPPASTRAALAQRDSSAAILGPAFYAARGGGWHDYWTLLHPPYTVWHLSYVLLGAAVAPAPDPRVVAGALLAFGLAVGVGAHAFDELRGRPLRTEIPASVLVALGTLALLAAAAIGLDGVTLFGAPFLLFVVAGVALVVLYAFEAPLVHSDGGFALGWGAFPVVATGYASGAHVLPIALAALAATLMSLAQRRLSTRARSIRRRAIEVHGEIVYADGSREVVDRRSLIGAPEAALSVLWVALLSVALAMLLAHWR